MKKFLLSLILLLGVSFVSTAQEKQSKTTAPKKVEKTSKAILIQKKFNPVETAVKQAAINQAGNSEAMERVEPIQPKGGNFGSKQAN